MQYLYDMYSRSEPVMSCHDAAEGRRRSCFLFPAGRVTSVRLPAVHARELLLAFVGVHAPHVKDIVVDVVVEDLQSVVCIFVCGEAR